MKIRYVIAILFSCYIPFTFADQSEGACQVYTAIQDTTKVDDIQNLTQPLKYPQTLQILRTFAWKFPNGNIAYVEFDESGNSTGRFVARTQSNDRTLNEVDFNNALLNHRLTLDDATDLMGDGQLIQYDFIDTFAHGPIITGFANSNGNILSTAINTNCGNTVSNKKVFQYTGSNNNKSVYESTDVPAVTTNNTTIQNYYPVQVPYYFGAPYFYNDQVIINNNVQPNNTVTTSPSHESPTPHYKTGPNIFPTNQPSPPYNVPHN